MKFLIALCLVSVAVAVPVYEDGGIQLLRYDSDNIGTGPYSYSFETSDGTKQEQVGELVNDAEVGQSESVRGSYSWVAPDGYEYLVKYVAGANGYQSTIEKLAKRF